MGVFTAIHRIMHDIPLVARVTIKRFFISKKCWKNFLGVSGSKTGKTCIVAVNGPSLKQDLPSLFKKNRELVDIVFVNYSALSDAFFQVKPNVYTFADPMFWRGDVSLEVAEKNELFFDSLKLVDWSITFLIPEEGLEIVKNKMGNQHSHNFISIPINPMPLMNDRVSLLMLNQGVCTPSFGNVLILALYCSIMFGYREISVYGADFDFFKQLQTNQVTNEVSSGGEHFYDKSYKPEPKKYSGRSSKMMHTRLDQVRNAFHQIFILSMLAHRRKVLLKNKSSYSLIDSLSR